MPSETFFNLVETKRNRIIEVAIDAFSAKDYRDVTISALVKASGIPKGSFYQYFEDKFDVYNYIVNLVGEKKIEYFTPVLPLLAGDDFFSALSELYKAGLQFSFENPRYAEIGTRLVKSSDQELRDKIYKDVGGKVDDFLGHYIREAIKRGEIRDDIDPKFLSYVFGQFNMVFADYFFNELKGDNFEAYVDNIDVMLDLFKNGASAK